MIERDLTRSGRHSTWIKRWCAVSYKTCDNRDGSSLTIPIYIDKLQGLTGGKTKTMTAD